MASMTRTVRLTAAESFWYLLGCIALGAMYLAKVPAKKALAEAGLAQLTRAERFWYRVLCVAFGAGYLAKLPVKQALSEMGPSRGGGHRGGPDRAGADRAGADRAGADRAGADRAGADRAGAGRAGTGRPDQPDYSGLVPAPRREPEAPAAGRHGRRQGPHQRRH
jgi:hypothetical protein